MSAAPFLTSFTLIEPDRSVEDEYVGELGVVKHLRRFPVFPFDSPVTFVTGENGVGKSMLVEAIAIAAGMNAEGGSKNFRFSNRASESVLHNRLKLTRAKNPPDTFFLRSETQHAVATEYEELGDVNYLDLHLMSHGESTMEIVRRRFGEGLYVLDEPESGLSPTRQMQLLAEMARLVDEGAQFIVATHSPILLALPGARILLIDDEGVRPVPWSTHPLVQDTREFLADPKAALKELLNDVPSED